MDDRVASAAQAVWRRDDEAGTMARAMLWMLGLGVLLSLGGPQRDPLRLRWIAPAACPSEATVIEQTEAWLVQSTAGRATVEARATVVPDAEGLRLELHLETPDGVVEQGTTSPDCAPLAEATALQVAMAIDPEAVALEVVTRAEAEAAEADRALEDMLTEEVTPEVTPRPPPPLPPPPVGLRGAAWVEGSVGGGRVPRVDGRLAAGGSLLLPWLRVDLGFAHTIRQRRAHPDLDGIALDVWQWGVLARGCGRPRVGPLELPLCGGAELGASVGRGDGLDRIRVARTPWFAALASAGLGWSPLRWLSIGVAAEGFVALRRSPFTVDALEPFFTPRVAGGTGLLRVEGRFP